MYPHSFNPPSQINIFYCLSLPPPLPLMKSSGYESLIKEYAIFICEVIQLDTSEYILMSQRKMELGVFTLTWHKDKWIKKILTVPFCAKRKGWNLSDNPMMFSLSSKITDIENESFFLRSNNFVRYNNLIRLIYFQKSWKLSWQVNVKLFPDI